MSENRMNEVRLMSNIYHRLSIDLGADEYDTSSP